MPTGRRPEDAQYFITASALTVLAGTALFWIDSGGDPIGWITRDGTGLALGIGGAARVDRQRSTRLRRPARR